MLDALRGTFLLLSLPVFTGQTVIYTDTAQGYRLRLPVEFQMVAPGSWVGPRLPTPTAIYVHVEPMPGATAAFPVHFKKYRDDPLLRQVTPVPLRHGLAFRAEEVIRPGQAPEDLHRWFLFVYAQERVYTVGMSGPLKAFQQGILPPIYTGVMQSFAPLPPSPKNP